MVFCLFIYFISLHRVSEFALSCTEAELCYLYQQRPATNLSRQTMFTVLTAFFISRIIILRKKPSFSSLTFLSLMHVHNRNCSSALKIDCKKILCGVPYLLCLSDFQIKYTQFGSKKVVLFFCLAALCIQPELWLKLGFLPSRASSTAGQITASLHTCLYSGVVRVWQNTV